MLIRVPEGRITSARLRVTVYSLTWPYKTDTFPLQSQARLESVIDQRTFDLMPVLEGVYDIGNVLAVCRSAEALGVGCLGVISDEGLVFKQSGRTSGGAVKWTHLDQWRSTTNAVADLKNRGYRVLVTVFEGTYFPITTFRHPVCPYETDIYLFTIRRREAA